MAWETDRHGRTQYVQKLRVDGSITSKILSSGESGYAAEQQLILDRATQGERRADKRKLSFPFFPDLRSLISDL